MLNAVTADQAASELTDELAGRDLDLVDLLTAATSRLARLRAGTWVALVMNPDPNTSLAVTGDENPDMVRWIDGYMASLVRPRVVPTTGVSRAVIESGEPLLLGSISIEEMWKRSLPAARLWFETHPSPYPIETVGTIVVPMRARDQLVGTLQHMVWNAAPLTAADVRWAEHVANRLGLVFEHAQCHTAARVRLERLTAVRNVGLTIASSDNLRLTLELILEQLVKRLQVDAADILLVDQAAGEMFLSASAGFRSLFAADVRMPIPKDVLEASAHGRQLDRSHDTRTDPDWLGQSGRRSLFVRERFEAYRAVSLVAHGKLVGMLEVFQRSGVEVDSDWLGFLEAMATDAAIAIYTANLRELAEKRAASRGPAAEKPELSRMEWRILAMVVEGATNREIAAAVHLSENTIKFHIRRLLDRLGAVNRTELARKATQNSWL